MSWCSVNDVIILWKKYPIVTNSWWHKAHEKDVVGIVTFDLIGLQQSHYFIYVLLLLFFWENLLFSFIFSFYFYQQTADYMQDPNTLNGYNLANSNYQFTS